MLVWVRRCVLWVGLLAFHTATAALPAGFSYQPIGSGWNEVVGAAFTEDGQLFAWERAGRVWRVNGTTKAASPFLDISSEVGAWRDFGMLGFALHPNFKLNGYVYVSYVVDRHQLVNCTEPASGSGAPICGTGYSATTDQYLSATIGRVTRYTAIKPSGDPDFLNATTVDYNSRKVLVGETPTSGCPILSDTHGVGDLAFGDDGTLFSSCGDGASGVGTDTGSRPESYWNQALTGSPQIMRQAENVGAYRAQMPTSLSGKVIRIDALTGDGVPGNPLYNPAAPRSPASRIWVLGLRNPFRISHVDGTGSHDPAAGNPGVLLIGDVGWLTWEEFDVSRTGGENFGWPAYEGIDAHSAYFAAITYNRDAPNPLFGVGGCAQQFFAFQDLLKPESLSPVVFKNPCNTAVNIPASVPTWQHHRPEIDYDHSPTSARWSSFDGLGNPVAYQIGENGVAGVPFVGNSSTAGVFYTGDDFPPNYKNTYFHADYGAGWIRNFILNGNFKPVAIDVFDDAAGPVVSVSTNPVTGGLYFVIWNGGINRVVYGTGNAAPVAVVSADRSYGTAPLTVQFSGDASHDPEGLPLTYLWDFGDGSATSTTANPSHTFNAATSAPESYTVSLQVTDAGGLSNTTTTLVSANNTPPVVNLLAPPDGTKYSLASPTTYHVSAAVTDAQHSAAQVVCSIRLTLHHNSHRHDDPPIPACQADVIVSPLGCGTESYYWRIGFTATDAAGLTGYDEVLLLPDCPSATLTANAGPDRNIVDSNGNGSEIVMLDGSASADTNGTIANYVWYRDGVQIATGVTANVSFSVGTHQVRLEVLNATGSQAADTAQVTIYPQGTNFPPTASFTVTPANGPLPFTVAVDASGSTDPDGTIINYAWVWGDGATTSGSAKTASHQYTVAGNYTVNLTVRDTGNATAATTRAVVAEVAWWNLAWGARRKLTFNNIGINTNLINMPVLVKLDPSRIDYAAVQPNGADLRFIDADNVTQLNYEIATWNPGGISTVWVKVPQIDANSATDSITLYYNNAAAPAAQNSALVWSNGYVAVWHFDANLLDATANANNGVDVGTTSESGYLGNARRFDGTGGYISAASSPSLDIATGALTIEAMTKRDADADPNVASRIVDKKLTAATNTGYGLQYLHATHTLTVLGTTSNSGNADADLGSAWVYVGNTISGTRAQLYVDGVNATTDKTVAGVFASTQPLNIGRMSGGGFYWDGLLDEIRISNVARTNDWMTAQQRSLTDALIVQPTSTNTLPTVAITSPAGGAILNAPSSLTISAAADDADGSVAQVRFYTDGALIGTDTSAPFSISWINPPIGAHTLTAVATDNANASAGSVPVAITLTTGPSIGITSPASGATVPGPGITINYNITGTGYDHLHLLLDAQPEIMVTNPTGSYTFQGVSNGPHDVAVFLVDAQHNALPNASATANVSFTVSPAGNQAPAVNAGPDQSVLVGAQAHFVGVVTDDGSPAPPAVTLQWTRQSGPGTPTWPLGDSNQAHTHVVFPVAGTYVLRLAANDGALTSSDTVTVTVNDAPNVAPSAAFTLSPTSGTVPLTVAIDAAGSTDSDGNIVNYAWNFGDGATSNGPSPTTNHQFISAANFTILLTVTDDDGATATTTHSVTAEPAWWNVAWRARRLLTFDNGGINTNLTNVPVLVKLDPSRVNYAVMKPSGADLRFVDADNVTVLDYEIATWNPGGVSTIWVKVPQIDANSTSDSITLYYNNPAAPAAQNPTAVWSNGYAAVWHFDTNLLDSTGNGNTGTSKPTALSTTSEAGYLGNARRFDGVSSYIDAGNKPGLAITGGLTIEAMVRRDADADPNTDTRVVDKKGGAGANDGYNLQYVPNVSTPSQSVLGNRSAGGTLGKANVDLGTGWRYLASTIEDTYAQVYVDGANLTVQPTVSPLVAGTVPLLIGRKGNGGSFWDGLLDEIRISNVARSAEWITAQQRSLSDGLITYQSGPDNAPPSVAVTTPADGAFFQVDSTFPIEADASDDGSIARVNFYAEGVLIGADTTAPYSIGWSSPTVGSHTLSAVATDNSNLSTASTPIHITLTLPLGNQPPSVSAGPDVAGVVGQSVLILGIANDDGLPNPPDLVLQWTTQSGPGTPMWTSGEGDQAQTHVVFPVAGTYVLRLTANDGEFESFDQVTVTVADLPNVVPAATFTVSPTSGSVPLTVTVDATGSVDPDGTIVGYAWDFGDGATTSGLAASTSHQYIAAGNYTITLTLTDNGGATASTTRAVSTADWWNTAWGARRALTFNNGGVDANLTNVPVLVKLDPNRINYAAVQPNGADLRFIDADNVTVLDYEIATWNPGGVSTVWVKVPQIDRNSTTDSITLYYNNPVAPAAQNPTAVWSNGYAAVWHFDANLNDSTANANNGVNQGTTGEAGYLGNARRFDGVSSYIDAGANASLAITPGLTIEALVKRDTDANPNNDARIIDKKGGAGGNDGYNLQYLQATDTLTNRSANGSFGKALVDLDGRWAYLASTIDGTYAQIYVDGNNLTIKPGVLALVSGAQPLAIGRKGSGGSPWDGLLDEIRISNVARSAEWITAQQRSLSDGLITYQTGSNDVPPTVTITTPANGAVLDAPSSLLVTATATDNGTVAHVSFYADGALLGTDTSAPFSVSWSHPTGGGHTLTAIAIDDGNLNAVSAPVAITVTGAVANQSPTVNAGPDRSGVVGQTLQIQGTTTDDGLPNPPATTSAQWTQRSGPGTVTWPLNDSNQAQTHVAFPVAGTYTLRLTASDSALTNFDELAVTVTVTGNASPVAAFTLNPTTGTAPLTITVDATGSSDADGSIAGYAWNFGDGTTGSGATTSHQYTAVGTYTVTLIVTDDDGAAALTTHVVTVESSLWSQIRTLKAAKH